MDIVKGKWTKNLINKVWKRCSTLPKQSSREGSTAAASLTRSKSWSSTTTSSSGPFKQKKSKAKEACQVAPVGCFTVYVGPEKQRFVVRMELVNHSMFKMMLEDAALEYGYKRDGPILLPCDVDLFCSALAEMESNDRDEDMIGASSSCSPISFSPARRRTCGSNRGYRLLTPTSSSSSSSSMVVT